MGTRSLTVFEDNGKEIAVLYRQFDGYLDGHGRDLTNLYSGIKMVNGIRSKDERVANGIPCLAAQTVAHFKQEPGEFYLYAPGTRDVWEDYIYTVTGNVGEEPCIKVESREALLFSGPASKLLSAIESGELEKDE